MERSAHSNLATHEAEERAADQRVGVVGEGYLSLHKVEDGHIYGLNFVVGRLFKVITNETCTPREWVEKG